MSEGRLDELLRRQRHDGRPWADYPLGTVAHEHTGCWWLRVPKGWIAGLSGNTWHYPGPCAFHVTLPLDFSVDTPPSARVT